MAELFDTYSRKARLYPALLAALPIATYLIVSSGGPAAVDIWLPILGTLGVQFFLASLVRSRGKRFEVETLIPKWGGMPTTLLLRHETNNGSIQGTRWRAQLEKLTTQRLPTPAEESDNASISDERYVAATRLLISRVRLSGRHPRVQEENINYGFARNLAALKPLAIAILIVAVAIDLVALAISGEAESYLILVSVHALLLVAWVFAVNKPWVRQVADAYAARLFEALDDPEIVEQ